MACGDFGAAAAYSSYSQPNKKHFFFLKTVFFIDILKCEIIDFEDSGLTASLLAHRPTMTHASRKSFLVTSFPQLVSYFLS